jgi:hypothetical protein
LVHVEHGADFLCPGASNPWFLPAPKTLARIPRISGSLFQHIFKVLFLCFGALLCVAPEVLNSGAQEQQPIVAVLHRPIGKPTQRKTGRTAPFSRYFP